jgi:kynurenine formamidase
LVPSRLPSYRELPIRPGLPAGSAWGVFGDDDQLGTLNLLTPERVASAARLARTGRVFPLSQDMDSTIDAMRRDPFRHVIEFVSTGADDHFDGLSTQGSTCWDSMSRIAHPAHGYYNGCRPEDITGRAGSRNGIDNAARHGIAGRFVLADLGRWREAAGRPFEMTASEAVEVDELEACLAATGVGLRTGDILVLRFGFGHWYQQATAEERGPDRYLKAGVPGLSHDASMAAWMWDRHVAAVVADNPTLEVFPFELGDESTFLHLRLIPLLGITVGELFALEDLAADCAADRVYEGLFVAAPLNKVGAVGSPGNALAIK